MSFTINIPSPPQWTSDSVMFPALVRCAGVAIVRCLNSAQTKRNQKTEKGKQWEQFIVVHGHGLIEERNINTGEKVSFEVSGDRIEAVYMIPGWMHNIINLSETEDLITVMTCNEVFDVKKPDAFFEKVRENAAKTAEI